MVCVDKCPNTTPPTYTDNVQQICTTLCTLGTFADPNSLTCVSNCSISNGIQYLADNSTRTCVQTCPKIQGTFADPFYTMSCAKSCPSPTFANTKTGLCS